jgi:hypothetical protein
MALVGNISGSGGVSNTIGITGSLIIANPGTAAFPTFPGADVALFVSGNIASKPATSPDLSVRGTTVFGGDVVISGTLFGGSPLHIGTFLSASQGAEIGGVVTFTSTTAPTFNNGLSGSLTKLADGTSYLIAGSNVTIATGTNGAVTISSTAAGGGGSNFFLDDAGAGKIYTTASSVAFPFGETGVDEAADKGTDVVFYVSGSAAGTATALFAGNIVTSGSVKIAGNITGDNTVARTIFSDVTDITIGGSSSTVNVAGDLKVSGNDIIASDSQVNITLTSNTLTEVKGDLQVSGNDIKMSGGTTAITFSGAGDVAVAGDLTVTGNDIKSSTATALTLAGTSVTTAGNLTVTGDLTVNGTTTTVNTDYLIVEDPTIYLANGAASSNQNGGIAIASGSSVAAQALVWGRVANDTWGAGRLDVRTGSVSDLSSMVLLPVRASKFEVGSANSFVTSSNGSNLTLNAASSNVIGFNFGGSPYAEILESGIDTRFGATGTKNLSLSGSSSVALIAGANGTIFQRDTNTIGSITGISATNMTFAARNAAGSTTSLVLTGSGVIIGANSAVSEFWFADSARGLASNANGFTLGSQSGINLNLSGSNNFLMRHGATGVGFQQHAQPYLTINSGSVALSSNTALVTADAGKAMLVGGSSTTIVSGSDLFFDAGANGSSFRVNSSTFASLSSPSANTITLAAGTGFTTANVLNTIATTVNFAGAGTDISIGSTAGGSNLYLKSATTNISGSVVIAGSTTLGDASGDNITFNGSAASHLIPNANNTFDLGSPSLRWRNMYTGDLHLRNERGDWTIIEEREFLSITNNHTGRRYKFVMQEI